MKSKIISLFAWQDQHPGFSVFVSALPILFYSVPGLRPLSMAIAIFQFFNVLPALRLLISDVANEINGPETMEQVVREWLDEV